MTTTPRPPVCRLLVAGLVVLAGRTGAFGGEATQDSQSVTAAPVPADTRYELAGNGTVTTSPDDGTVPYLDSASGGDVPFSG